MVFCTRCGTPADVAARFCAQCGRTLTTARAQDLDASPAPDEDLYANPGQATPTSGVAIVALLLNILVWPGLGSLVAGEKVGWAQGFLFLAGIPLSIVLIGIPMLIGAWIWGIVTGVDLMRRADAARTAAPA